MAALCYLALGDSYTIGTGASEAAASFPSLLARRLEDETGTAVTVQNPAVNGYTSRDLIERELPQVAEAPHLCTVLIGANDVVQGIDEAAFRRNLGVIYDFVRGFELPQHRVTALSIPDFSSTTGAGPFGAPEVLWRRIEALNAVAREEAGRRAFDWVDLTSISRSGAGRPGWTASDGLHPSDSQYRAWAGWIWERVRGAWIEAAARLAPSGS